jgi:TRAP-type C4-dicarboxylate transport system substrate-binding protein
MIKRSWLVSLVVAFAFCLPTMAVRAEPVVLKGIIPWQKDYDLSKSFFIFQDLVNERLKGKVKIEYLGGPEVQQPNDQFAAVRNGIVDVILGAAAYYRSEVPAAAAVQFTKKLPHELRESGYFDVMRRLHAKHGVVYLANTAGGNRFRIYLLKKISKPDFSGLRIRVSPVYLPLVKALGGTPVSVAPGEVYTALERNAIDGYGWTYTGIGVFGWQEKTKYVIDHPFYSLDTAILMNQKKFDSLPSDVRKTLNDIGAEVERRVEAQIAKRLVEEDKKLKKDGIKFIKFSDADAKTYLDTAYNAGWKDFIEKNKALLDKNPGLIEELQKKGQ